MSAAAIARAKADGAKVTSGVSINNLSLNENDVGEYRTFFRLAPPLRAEDDRLAMIEALQGRHDRHHRLLARSAGCRHQAPALRRCRGRRDRAGDAARRSAAAASQWRRAAARGWSRRCRPRRQDCSACPAGRWRRARSADLVARRSRRALGRAARAGIRSRSKNTCFEGARLQGKVLQTMVAGRTVFSVLSA